MSNDYIELGFHDDELNSINIDMKNKMASLIIQKFKWIPKKDNPKSYRSELGKIVEIRADLEEDIKINLENLQCSREISEVYIKNNTLIVNTISGSIILKITGYKINEVTK